MNLVTHEVADMERIYTSYRQAEVFHKQQESVCTVDVYKFRLVGTLYVYILKQKV